jgi:hypothetical protein
VEVVLGRMITKMRKLTTITGPQSEAILWAIIKPDCFQHFVDKKCPRYVHTGYLYRG